MSKTSRLTAHPARLVAAGLVLALAGAFTLTAQAAGPMGGAMAYGGGHGGPGGPHAAMHGGGMDMPGIAGGPRRMERMLDAVNATAEQRTQVRSIMQAAMTELRAQREAGRGLHDQARQLWAQPNIDANAAEALRQQMMARHDAASKRMMQAMLEASRVLTPEQRKQLAERMAQGRAMMERHRAERQTLEGRK